MEKQSSELHSDLLTRWVFGINRFLGNWPFTSQIFTPFALWDWLRMISISSIYVTCTWCQIQSEYIGLSYGSWIEKNLITVAILTYNFTALSSIVIVIWNRDALLRIVSIKKEFDNKMKMMDHRVDERSFKRHFLIFLLVALGLTTLSTVTSTGPYVTLAMAADNISAATNAIFHSVQLWVLVVAQLGLFIIYHYFLLSMQMRYHCLNIALEKTLAASKDFASKSYKLTLSDGYFDGLAEFASRIAVLHSHLTEGVRLINKCYAFQIMVYMGCSFASTVGTLFSMYRRSNIGEQYTMNFQITCLLWIMHGLLIVAGTIYVANITVKEARTTVEIMYTLMLRVKHLETFSRLMGIAHQLKNRIPIISCGLFSFDWPLLQSMIGACTTYLIILIQFDVAAKPTDSNCTQLLNITKA